MQKLVMKLNNHDDLSDLPYRHLQIYRNIYSRSNRKTIKRYLATHNQMIETIKLNGANDFVVKVLSSVTNLTELSLYKYNAKNEFKIDLPNLKTLILNDASTFIDHVHSHKIETLKIAESIKYNKFRAFSDQVNRKEFLKTCVQLKDLHMQNFLLNLDLFCDYPFQLTSLKIIDYYCCRGDAMYVGNEYDEFLFKIMALIRSQKDSLKKISLLVYAKTADPDILNFMVNDMKLEELSWIYDMSIPMNRGAQKDNLTLKKFKFKVSNFTDMISVDFYDVLKALQAVEHLDIEFSPEFPYELREKRNEFLRFLHSYMPKMKTLTIRKFIDGEPRAELIDIYQGNLLIPQAETFIIHELTSDDRERMQFIVSAPNIKKLIIKGGKEAGKEFPKDFDCLWAGELWTILIRLTKLEELLFRGRMEIDDEVLALISQSKLRRITIENYASQLTEAIETCERLKAANKDLIVIRRQVTSKNCYDNEEDELIDLFATPEDY